MKHVIFLLAFLLYISQITYGQCKDGFKYSEFINNGKIRIVACIQLPSTENSGFYIGQRVSWTVYNLTTDKLEVKFTAVYYLTCGNVLNKQKETVGILQAYGKESGSGAIDPYLEDYISKENCSNATNRLSKVVVENVQIKNISEEERQEVKRKEQDEVNQIAQENLQKQQRQSEKAKQETLQKQKDENQKKQQQLQQMQDNYNNKMEAIKNGTDPTIQAVNQVGDILKNIIQDNLEAKRRQRAEEQARLEQQRLAEEQAEIKRQMEETERQKIMLQKQIDFENKRKVNYEKVQQLLGSWGNKPLQKPYQVIDDSLDKIYYLAIVLDEVTLYLSEPIEMKKDKDGTFPLFADLLDKLSNKFGKNILNIICLGYFSSFKDALAEYKFINAKAIMSQSDGIIKVESFSLNQQIKSKKDFWNDDTEQKAKPKQDTSKSNTSFWDN